MPRQISLSSIQILLILSILLITSQLLLLLCDCRCKIFQNDVAISHDGCNNVGRQGRADEAFCNLNITCDDILALKDTIRDLRRRLEVREKLDKVLISQDISYLKKRDGKQALRSYTPKSKYDVIPFDSLTLTAIYGEVGFLSKVPAETISGRRGIEHNEVIRFSVNTLNDDVESKSDHVLPLHLAEGIMRNDRLSGTLYEMHFRSDIPNVFKRIKVIRPFGALETIGKSETVDTSKILINIIVPLSGRVDKFKEFVDRFVEVGIRYDRRVYLTVIFFGAEGRDKIRQILSQMSTSENFTKYKVIFTNQEFSRGAALQKGASSWIGGNVILFFCDVDVYFTSDFLERCRLYTSPGKRVYYPIVFSQYNPIIVYGGQTIPPLRQQMKLSHDSGFWRDFGFGMTCQYRDDFFKIGGFDLSIKGWGTEDVRLYQKYLHSELEVIRAYDRNIFHIYHEKKCSRNLSDEQFISCLQSKAVAEGSHKQMGMLAFGKYLLGNEHPDWGKLLESSLTGAVEQATSEDVPNVNSKTKPVVETSTNAKENLNKNPAVTQNISENSQITYGKKNEISAKLADDIMTYSYELQALYNDIKDKISYFPKAEEFQEDLKNLQDFQRKLQQKAALIFPEQDNKIPKSGKAQLHEA